MNLVLSVFCSLAWPKHATFGQQKQQEQNRQAPRAKSGVVFVVVVGRKVMVNDGNGNSAQNFVTFVAKSSCALLAKWRWFLLLLLLLLLVAFFFF